MRIRRKRKSVLIGGRRWERDRGRLFEVRRRSVGRVTCADCDRLCSVYQQTCSWVRGNRRGTRWRHAAYGPGAGTCPCGMRLAQDLDGSFFSFRSPDQLGLGT